MRKEKYALIGLLGVIAATAWAVNLRIIPNEAAAVKIKEVCNTNFNYLRGSGWITNTDIADSSITSLKIQDGTITNADIAVGAVASNKIPADQIQWNHMQAGSVMGRAEGSVVFSQIRSNTIGLVNMGPMSIAGSGLGNYSGSTRTNIFTHSIGSNDYQNASIFSRVFSTGCVTSLTIQDSTISNADFGLYVISNNNVAANGIDTSNILDRTISSNDLAVFFSTNAHVTVPDGLGGIITNTVWITNGLIGGWSVYTP